MIAYKKTVIVRQIGIRQIIDAFMIVVLDDIVARNATAGDDAIADIRLFQGFHDFHTRQFGFRIEHYTDGDVVNDLHRPSVFAGTADETTQWGAKPPLDFFS